MPSPRRLFVALAFAGLGLAAHALEWKASTLTVATKPFQTTQDVVFEFKNAGAKPVTLVDIQTNCDCLDATSDQNVYAPGATGTIKARFTIGDRSGLYERLVTVVTDEEPNTARLILRIEVPEIAAVTPRSVEWKVNEAPGEKSVEITPAAGLDLTFNDAQATNNAFSARLETSPNGKSCRVYLKPRTTAQPASAAIRIFGKDKSGHDVVVSAYGTIQ